MRRWGSVQQLTGCAPGDHVCWVRDEERGWHDEVTAYLHEGAQAGEQLVYVADGDPTALLAELADLPRRDELHASGQLQVLPLSEVYGPMEQSGTVTDEMTQAQVRAAADGGYAGVRVASDLSRLPASDDPEQHIVARELLVDRVVATSRATFLCGYPRSAKGAAAQARVVHPLHGNENKEPPFRLFADADGSWWLTGSIDLTGWELFAPAVSALPVDDEVRLRCASLEFIDVRSTRTLVELARRLPPRGRLVLHDPPRVLQQILDVCWPDAPGLAVVGA